MKRKMFTTAAFICGYVMVCFAMVADMSGTWVGTLKSPNGDYPLKYTFKPEGDKDLSGTALTPGGMVPIAGKIADGGFTFTVNVNNVAIKNQCKYYPEGDSIGVTLDYNGFKMHSTLTREAKK